DENRLDVPSVERHFDTASMVERRQFDVQLGDDWASAGVRDRPSGSVAHPLPRPLRIVLARREARDRPGINPGLPRDDAERLAVVETRGETESVRRDVTGDP